MNLQRSCSMFYTERQRGGYQCLVTKPLQLPTSPTPCCFTNFVEVALVAVVALSLPGAHGNCHLIEITKVISVTVPILSCLWLHQKQMVAFPAAESQLRFVALVFLSPSTACQVGPPAQVWLPQKIEMGPLWADLGQGSSLESAYR